MVGGVTHWHGAEGVTCVGGSIGNAVGGTGGSSSSASPHQILSDDILYFTCLPFKTNSKYRVRFD